MNHRISHRNTFRCLMLFIGIFLVIQASAQKADTARVLVEDGYIEKMGNKIAFDVSLNNAYEIFEVLTPQSRFVLNPNTATNIRLKLNYRFISVGYQFAPDFIPGNGDETTKGKTKTFGLGTALVFKHWFFDVAYNKVQGYYLANSDDFIVRAENDPYILFPDLHYKGVQLAAGYSSNSKFSFRSLTSQTERQLKSAGSFIPVWHFRYYEIDDQSDGASSQKSTNLESSLGPGYAYTYVFRSNYFISATALGSLGYLNTQLTTRTPEGDFDTTQDNFVLRWEARAGIGYNGRQFYSGLYTNVSGTQYQQQHTTATNIETRIFYHLYVGIRLKAPEVLDQKMKNLF